MRFQKYPFIENEVICFHACTFFHLTIHTISSLQLESPFLLVSNKNTDSGHFQFMRSRIEGLFMSPLTTTIVSNFCVHVLEVRDSRTSCFGTVFRVRVLGAGQKKSGLGDEIAYHTKSIEVILHCRIFQVSHAFALFTYPHL